MAERNRLNPEKKEVMGTQFTFNDFKYKTARSRETPLGIDYPIPKRRILLRAAAYLPALALLPRSALAEDFWNLPRELWLIRKSTGEQVRTVYWADGQLIPDGYIQICHILRDVQVAQTVQMDLVLLDILRGIYGWFDQYGATRPIILNSGYRSVHTNAMTEGAARNSMHTLGKAADLWMQGVPTEYMGRLGASLNGGGVGFYANKGFVHVDSGRLRVWRG